MNDIYTETLHSLWGKSKPEEIVRQVYISYPTYVFKEAEAASMGYAISNEISNFFNISLSDVQIVGSAKTGKSYFKNKDFEPGESDLDIAIISSQLFLTYMEISFVKTKGYTDLKDFKNGRDYRKFKDYLSRGIFRPDLMPRCTERMQWFKFFSSLSNQYYKVFKDINAGIYISQSFFEFKQIEGFQKYMEKFGGIDS